MAPNQGQTPEQTEQAEAAGMTIIRTFRGEYKSVKHGFVIQNHNGGRLVTRGVAVKNNYNLDPLTDGRESDCYGIG